MQFYMIDVKIWLVIFLVLHGFFVRWKKIIFSCVVQRIIVLGLLVRYVQIQLFIWKSCCKLNVEYNCTAKKAINEASNNERDNWAKTAKISIANNWTDRINFSTQNPADKRMEETSEKKHRDLFNI